MNLILKHKTCNNKQIAGVGLHVPVDLEPHKLRWIDCSNNNSRMFQLWLQLLENHTPSKIERTKTPTNT